jgi:hypothetical protein
MPGLVLANAFIQIHLACDSQRVFPFYKQPALTLKRNISVCARGAFAVTIPEEEKQGMRKSVQAD